MRRVVAYTCVYAFFFCILLKNSPNVASNAMQIQFVNTSMASNVFALLRQPFGEKNIVSNEVCVFGVCDLIIYDVRISIWGFPCWLRQFFLRR